MEREHKDGGKDRDYGSGGDPVDKGFKSLKRLKYLDAGNLCA